MDSQWESMYDAGNPRPVLCDNLEEGWGGGGGSSRGGVLGVYT